jgi:hypothetical protein
MQLKQLACCRWVISDRGLEGRVGDIRGTRGAAIGVRNDREAREPWRIMTADPAIDGH